VTVALEVVFWASLAALVWTHVAYPAAMGILAALHPDPVRSGDVLPHVTLIITAHDEEAVIADRIGNALALDYPSDRLEIVVASDASGDRTDEIVRGFSDRGVRLLACPRAGKTATQDRAVRATSGTTILAFSDANVMWEPDALRRLTAVFADPRVAMVCGRVLLEAADGGTNQEGLYWRYEMWLRERESRVGSITASNGGIYALRREHYRELDPRVGHDLSFPHRMVKAGMRAVYEPRARARERMAADIGDEFGRKVRMFSQSWRVMIGGGLLDPRGVGAVYFIEVVSHRLLRYSIGILHVLLLASSIALAPRGGVYLVLLVAQLAGIGLALVSMLLGGRVRGISVLHYYAVLVFATLVGLWRAVKGASPAVWEKAAGTRPSP
jgi:cellulose synthase/poly-beta-1,6-N-acetylglucosamine synthase-like glycosyltransferase